MLTWPNKDPDDVIDYELDWSEFLPDSDTIDTATWSVSPAGLTVDLSTITGKVVKVWLSGGTEGSTYQLRCRIDTSEGRTVDQTVSLVVSSR